MSTREEILSHLTYSLNQEKVFTHEAESAAEKLIDDFLHEEAEKLRKLATKEYSYWQLSLGKDALERGADLIDPYKE